MFTILYILMVSNGVYYFEPLIQFETLSHCEEVQDIFEYHYPDFVFECTEYRDA